MKIKLYDDLSSKEVMEIFSINILLSEREENEEAKPLLSKMHTELNFLRKTEKKTDMREARAKEFFKPLCNYILNIKPK